MYKIAEKIFGVPYLWFPNHVPALSPGNGTPCDRSLLTLTICLRYSPRALLPPTSYYFYISFPKLSKEIEIPSPIPSPPLYFLPLPPAHRRYIIHPSQPPRRPSLIAPPDNSP